MKPIKWPINFNRPLSREERDIANRLNLLTREQLADMKNPECEPREFFNGEGHDAA